MDFFAFQFVLCIFFANYLLVSSTLISNCTSTSTSNGTTAFKVSHWFNFRQKITLPLNIHNNGTSQITTKNGTIVIHSTWNLSHQVTIGHHGDGSKAPVDTGKVGTTKDLPSTTTTTSTTTLPPTTTTQPLTTTQTPSKLDFPPSIFPSTWDTSTRLGHRRAFIRNMTLDAWNAYVTYAWGAKWLRPISQTGSRPLNGRTIVSALPTLYILGLNSEFQKAKEYVTSQLVTNGANERSIYDLHSSLLSTYAMTGEKEFLEIERKFSALSRRPDTGSHINELYKSWRFRRLEFAYLSDLTMERKFDANFQLVDEHLDSLDALDVADKTFGVYFLMRAKAFLQNPLRAEAHLVDRLFQKIDLFRSSSRVQSSSKYFISFVPWYNRPANQSNVEACQYGTSLFLASCLVKTGSPLKTEYIELAKRIGELCHLAANSTATGLPADEFAVNLEADNLVSVIGLVKKYHMLTDSELAELYFTLWRVTKDEKYREYAWELAQALNKHSRTSSGGFNDVDYVNVVPGQKGNSDVQYPQLLGATLKYLYLTFSPDDLLPLEKWVFAYDGHPLPICGKNRAYPLEKCAKNV